MSSDERPHQRCKGIDALNEAGKAFIASPRLEGWIPVTENWDDSSICCAVMALPKQPCSTSCAWTSGHEYQRAAGHHHEPGEQPSDELPFLEEGMAENHLQEHS